MVDRVKVWEETAGPGGEVLFPRIRRRLEAAYAARLAPLRRAHRTRFLERATSGSADHEFAAVAGLHRTVEALRGALARAEAERETAAHQWEEQREAAQRDWERERETERAAAADRLECALAELAALRASTLWRLTGPLRGIGSRHPRLARLGRHALRLVGRARRPLHRTRITPVPDAACEPVPPPDMVPACGAGSSAPEPASLPDAVPCRATFTLIETAEPEEIAFPEPDARIVVSVIVPTFGKVGYTLRCLASMARDLPDVPIEIIVVDDASRDPEIERLARVRGIRLVVNEANLGFLRSCNAAARLARGEFVFFLNNDTQVLPGWLDPMVALMRARPDAGAVGCKLLFADGSLQEAGAIVWDNATGRTYGRGDDPEKPEYNYVREVDYVSGAALLVRAELFARLGGFDEMFAPAYCEDSDLAFRIRETGRKVLYQPLSRIVHFEGVTNGTDLTEGVKRFNEVNQPKLLAKWSRVLAAEHYPPDMNLLRACERVRDRRIVLVLGAWSPAPVDGVVPLLRLLAGAGLVVKFCPLDGAAADTAMLRDLGVEVLHGGAPEVRRWIAEHGAELDAAILTDAAAAEALLPALRLGSRARLIYRSAWTGSGTPEWRERSIWRSVEAVLHGSEQAASEAEWLEPATDASVLGTSPETVVAWLGLDSPIAEHVSTEAALAA